MSVEKRMYSRLTSTLILFGFLLLAESAGAAFISRLGGQAFYDDVLDVTWAADSALSGYVSDPFVWVAGLTIDGVGGWRLPSVDVNRDGIVIDCGGGGVSGCADNEFGHLYWESGITFATPGPFLNLGNVAVSRWRETSTPQQRGSWFWAADVVNGKQYGVGDTNCSNRCVVWAVRDGDVFTSQTPEPSTIFLLGTALVGLVGYSRRPH